MRSTIPLWSELESLPQGLQEDVSDCAYRVFLSSASPLRKDATGKAVTLLQSELTEAAGIAVAAVKMLATVRSGLKAIIIDKVVRESGAYKVDTRIITTDKIPQDISFFVV